MGKYQQLKAKCKAKVAYNSPQEAYQQGQQFYRCKFCKLWHRTGIINRLVKEIRQSYRFSYAEKQAQRLKGPRIQR